MLGVTILLIGFLFTYLIKKAPEGFQDEEGFHYGVKEDWEIIYEEEFQKKINDSI